MIEMMDKVKDTVSGFAGTATGRCEYANGCVQWQVTAATLEAGKRVVVWIDEPYLKVVRAAARKRRAPGSGGPQLTPPDRSHPA